MDIVWRNHWTMLAVVKCEVIQVPCICSVTSPFASVGILSCYSVGHLNRICVRHLPNLLGPSRTLWRVWLITCTLVPLEWLASPRSWNSVSFPLKAKNVCSITRINQWCHTSGCSCPWRDSTLKQHDSVIQQSQGTEITCYFHSQGPCLRITNWSCHVSKEIDCKYIYDLAIKYNNNNMSLS